MRKWFQPEIDFLTRHWNDYTAKEIGEMLKFSESAVSSMASKLGLKKSRDFKRRSFFYTLTKITLSMLVNWQELKLVFIKYI